MKTRFRSLADVKVGMTIFIGLLILLFLLFAVGTEQNVFVPTYTLKLFVTDVKGLVPGSMVSLGGLKVGRVDNMEFARYDGIDGIVISMSVKKEYHTSITHASAAIIKTIGMLGDKYVDVSFGERGEPIEENGFLPLRTTFDLAEAADSVQMALNKFTAILSDLGAVTHSLTNGRGTVGRLLMDTALAQDLQTSIRSLRAMTDAVGQKKGSLGKFVYDEELYANLKHTADNIRSLSDTIRNGSGSLGRLLRDDSLYRTMHEMVSSLNTIFVRAASDSSSVGPLLNSDDLYKQLTSVLSGLNSLIDEIKSNPKKFIHLSVF